MNVVDALELGSNLWVSLTLLTAFGLCVFLCSAFSMQVCMAYFGEDIPTFTGSMVVTIKLIVSVGAILLVGYGFLGPLYILAAPPAIIAGLSIIGKVAQCDRFAAATIALSHTTMTVSAALLCGFVFWMGLSTAGVDMESKAEDLYAIAAESSHDKPSYAERRRRRGPKTRGVSHSNPFVESGASTSSPSSEQED